MAYALRESPAIRDLNVTPLIDVLLVLLVVFLLATPPLLNRVDVALPQDTPPPPEPPERIVLTVAADGRLLWNGVALPAAALAPQFAFEARRTPQPIVALDVAANARFEEVTGVLAITQGAGMRSVGFLDAP